MPVTDSITSLANGTYPVTRVNAGTFTAGRYTEGGTSTLAVVASIQPVTGRDLKEMPEGQHAEDVVVIYTRTQLYTREKLPAQSPDIVTYEGSHFAVVKVERWAAFGTVHYRCWAARQEIP